MVIAAPATLAPVQCIEPQPLSFETFDGGDTAGWSLSNTISIVDLGEVFGPFGGGTGNPSKTYTVPASAAMVRLSYTMIELGNWDAFGPFDNDRVAVRINDNEVFRQELFADINDVMYQGGPTSDGITWSITADTPAAGVDFGYASGNPSDQVFTVVLEIPANNFVSGSFSIELQTQNLNSDLLDEAVAYDNIRLTALYSCESSSPSASP